MANLKLPDFSKYIEAWAADLDVLRQNDLLSESRFISFANDRQIPVDGVVTGAPGELYKDGWFACDDLVDGAPLFHPFRIYPLFTALRRCKFNIAPTAFLDQEKLKTVVEFLMDALPKVEQIKEKTIVSDRISNLAILLEPLYWPHITGQTVMRFGLEEGQREEIIKRYRDNIITLLRNLDLKAWEAAHEQLRIDAAQMDDNHELYLLLRLSSWGRRKELKRKIAGALWIRHIAEIIRRAFEEHCNVKWKEEDQAFGQWYSDARLIRYGSDRPLDNTLKSKPYLAWNYGLFTGSVARWYVEGETEYHAILYILPNYAEFGIELVNLRGNIALKRDNIALKLKDMLMSDRTHRRFSIMSLDEDVTNNLKFVRRQINQNTIVGYLAVHKPDFEFANFSIGELVEVAACIDEANSVSGDSVRNADWKGIDSGKKFEEKYISVSMRSPRSLKGKEWGEALAKYANEIDPNLNGVECPFWREIRAALQARSASYDLHHQEMKFNVDTFDLVGLT